jgi:hypothetical protein
LWLAAFFLFIPCILPAFRFTAEKQLIIAPLALTHLSACC